MSEAVDSKKLLSKSYSTWRLVMAAGAWSELYRERMRKYGNYRSAIIFPEQILGLNQSSIYSASVVANGNTMSSSIGRIGSFELWADLGGQRSSWTRLRTVEEVYDFEAANSTADGYNYLAIQPAQTSTYNSKTKFAEYGALFSGKSDAVKWVARQLEKQVGNI